MTRRELIEGIFRLIEAGSVDDAESQCRAALAGSVDDVNLTALLGAICLKQGALDEAERHLVRATELEPAFPKPWEDLAALWHARGNRTEAERCLAHAVSLAKGGRPADPRLAEARRLLDAGRANEAAKICQAIVEREPGHPGALRLLAIIATDQERFVVAEGYLKRIVSGNPEDPQAVGDLARFLGERGRYRDAAMLIEQSDESVQNNAAMQRLLGDTLAVLGRNEDALAAYERCIERRPDDVEALCGKGHMLRIVGRRDEALAAYRRCVELRPGQGEYWWHLVSLHGNEADAHDVVAIRSALESGASTGTSAAALHFTLARTLEADDDFENAWKHYEAGNALYRQAVRYDPVENELGQKKIAEVFGTELLDRDSADLPDARTPIFIVGMPRSGSTLIEQILASHSQVHGGGELPYVIMLTKALHAADDPERRYPEIVADYDAGALTGLGRTYLHHVTPHVPVDRPYFTDKMPANYQHAGFIRMALPHAKIIDARRGPLATCVANYRQLYAQGKNQSYDLMELAEYYINYARLMSHWDEVMPGHILRVQYEDVVADLEGQVRRILSFCGLPFEAACVEFHRSERPVNTASSEQVREPIYTSAVDFWRNYEPWLDELKSVLRPVL